MLHVQHNHVPDVIEHWGGLSEGGSTLELANKSNIELACYDVATSVAFRYVCTYDSDILILPNKHMV